ncbi:MAG: hypothetical protein JO223_17945 [Hyphomicrobiales bacterium]|nr:hypothetical protein [Hyphomicrobiales bacterium]
MSLEPLLRAEASLTALERAAQTAEYARLTAPKRGEVQGVQVGQPDGRYERRGDSQAARALSIIRQEVIRAKKIDALADDVKAAAVEAGISDNQSALLRVADTPAEGQVEAAKAEGMKAKAPRKARREKVRTEKQSASCEPAGEPVEQPDAAAELVAVLEREFVGGFLDPILPFLDKLTAEELLGAFRQVLAARVGGRPLSKLGET